MSTHKQLQALVLHCDREGLIWQGGNGLAAVGHKLTPAEYVARLTDDGPSLRVLGSAGNAELISLLFASHKKHKRPYSIQLGSPSLCGAMDDCVPREILRRMQANVMDGPPSVGGWHTMTGSDYTSYALIQELRRGGDKLSKLAHTLLQAHPAWPAVSFFRRINLLPAATLLSTLVDPRWYIDPVNPDRSARLKQYMGLGDGNAAKIITAFMQERSTKARYADRVELVLNTWTGGRYTPPKVKDKTPNDFLWNVYEAATVTDSQQPAIALVRCCHVFLRFVRDVWLDNLTPPRQYRQVKKALGRKSKTSLVRSQMQPCAAYAPTLFLPENFFTTPAELKAWQLHLAAVRK